MQSKKSEKIHLIDFSTFERIQSAQNNSSNVNNNIRNAKYRKKHKNDENNFDLSAWINQHHQKRAKKAKSSHFKKGATLLKPVISSGIRKSGKVSENKRKKLTRLKKSILRYRVLKNQNERDKAENTGHEEAQLLTSCNKSISPEETAMAVVEPLIGQLLSIDLKADEINKEQQPHGKLAVIADKFQSLTIHSRRFREYCDNCTTQELVDLTQELLQTLNHFQRRAFAKNPVKANAHRRFVIGFHEAQNHLNIKQKVKLLIIATDCEKCTEKGGIDYIIENLKSKCQTSEIPYCFVLDRRKLAYALHKKGMVSCVAILDYDGVRDKFTQLIEALKVARQSYLTATATEAATKTTKCTK